MPKKDNPENSNSNSQSDISYILMLTDAEKRAREVIEAAKKRKNLLIKKCKDESGVEIEAFKQENENALQRKIKQNTIGQDSDTIMFEKEHEKKIQDLKAAFRIKSRAVLNDILYQVINFEPKFHENLII